MKPAFDRGGTALELHNEQFTVVSSVETRPSLENFDIVHNTENINLNDFYMARVFHAVRSDGQSITFALIDLICAGYEPYAALSENILTVILFSAIVRVDLDTGMIVQYTKCDNMGGLFEIHPIDHGYIIWGEGDIFRYDSQLNRVWHFMGRDILVSLAANKHFWIEGSLIHCRDFSGWHYIVDLDGKLVHNYLEFEDAENQ